MVSALSLKIFWVFFKLSIVSFGGVFGVLPELEREIVLQNGWMTHDQFIQSYVLAQIVPGPNMVMCPMIGYRVHGWAGFVAAFFGIYTAPLFLMGGAFWLYSRSRKFESVRKIELGLRPLVIGLLSASAIHLWLEQATRLFPSWGISVGFAGILTVLGLYLNRKAKMPALAFLMGAGLITFLAALSFRF